MPVMRPYTPISAGDEPGYLSFLVKKYPNGKGSGHMHSLAPGQTLNVRAIAELEYKPNQYSDLTVIAGGAGITPFLQLIRTVFNNSADKTKVNLVYANSTEQDILLKSEFDELQRKYPDRFRASYVVAHPAPGTGAEHSHGHITKAILQQALPDQARWPTSKVLVCGPPPMVEAIAGAKGGFGWTQGPLRGILAELGCSKELVQKF